MKIKNREILGRSCFDEITNPTQLFEYHEFGILCVSHSYYAQWSGRHLELRKENLSIYSSETLNLISHIDELKFPINDIDFDKGKQLLLIATGSYDGGYFYEGELFCYDLSNRKLIKLIEDNREFSTCKFKGSEIEFKVLPSNDYHEEFTLSTYSTTLDLNNTKSLRDLNLIESTSYDENSYNFEEHQRKLRELPSRLSLLANKIDFNYQHRSMAWDLTFIDDNNLFIGFAQGKVGILEISKNKLITRRIAENGDCAQVFKGYGKEGLYVNLSYRKIGANDYNTVFRLDNSLTKSEVVAQGAFSLSQSDDGNFLARQADYEDKKRKDVLFDRSFRKVTETRLGHYDLFNHYIRIDGESNLFALVGKPREQYQNKELIELSSNQLTELSATRIESQPEHLNNLNGVKIEEKYILEGKIYDPSPSKNDHVVFALNKQGIKLWQTDISEQTSGITKLENHPDYVCLVLVSGELLILDCSTGKTHLKIERNKDMKGYPLSVANKGNKIAIGYDNGLVELIEIE